MLPRKFESMPKLPDVECYKRYLDATSLHQAIDHVRVDQPGILEGTSPQALGRQLKGRRFEHTRRHGKYLFVDLSGDGWLVLHFGMTGDLRYFRNPEDVPEYTDLLFVFDNGFHLAYIAPRKLGLVTVVDKMAAFVRDKQLGPDALTLDYKRFRELAVSWRGGVKSWLMDQQSIAGIGNIYSDEILFQSGIHPRRAVKGLSETEIKNLYKNMREVLHTAIQAQADPKRMPAAWLQPQREVDGRCPRCGGPIETVSAAGRRAYFCPHCQPKNNQ